MQASDVVVQLGRLVRRCGGPDVRMVLDVFFFAGKRLGRAARDSIEFDALLEFEENLICRIAHELKVVDDEYLLATVGYVCDFGNAFVAPSSLVDLIVLVVLERLTPAGGDASFVGFDPAAPRT